MTTRDLVPRQGQTYNRQNWAYKIANPGAGASIGTGVIFATGNSGGRGAFARRCEVRRGRVRPRREPIPRCLDGGHYAAITLTAPRCARIYIASRAAAEVAFFDFQRLFAA